MRKALQGVKISEPKKFDVPGGTTASFPRRPGQHVLAQPSGIQRGVRAGSPQAASATGLQSRK